MPDWTWILIVAGVLALAIVVARTVIGLSPRNESARAATAAHEGESAGTEDPGAGDSTDDLDGDDVTPPTKD